MFMGRGVLHYALAGCALTTLPPSSSFTFMIPHTTLPHNTLPVTYIAISCSCPFLVHDITMITTVLLHICIRWVQPELGVNPPHAPHTHLPPHHTTPPPHMPSRTTAACPSIGTPRPQAGRASRCGGRHHGPVPVGWRDTRAALCPAPGLVFLQDTVFGSEAAGVSPVDWVEGTYQPEGNRVTRPLLKRPSTQFCTGVDISFLVMYSHC